MMRTRALAATAIGIVLAGAVWRAAAVPADNSAAATKDTHPLDQQYVWQAWKLYCDSCHLGPRARAGVNLETLDLAISTTTAPPGRRCCAHCAPA